ncbi:LLM class flavin-dependent oxidoreductase [Actinomycetospora chiangmaiensis]|uniref:LLM class flavin-dependent oxidoreductase n=1 Tax=Actinomycetospora chiangmaiensis TaxID=402650 RepID=UPI000475FF0F|nr:LLM class flavin-dependent oxidoreductase [Actinomycetospora chiangmaiensis]
MSAAVVSARAALGPLGTYLPVPVTGLPPVAAQIGAARRLEAAGYRAAWTNETVGGKDTLVQVATLLAATDRLVLGTGIANVWARAPQTAHAAAAFLTEAYLGRIVLGLGAGHPVQAEAVGREYGRPLAVLRDYVRRMDAPTMPPAPDAAYARILAAQGPRLTALAAEIADGALPAMRPPGATARARAALGPDKLLVVAIAALTDPEPDRARVAADELYGGLVADPAYGALLVDLGLDPADPSTRDAVVAHGDPEAFAAAVEAHRRAGADHVVLLGRPGDDLDEELRRLERLAPELVSS